MVEIDALVVYAYQVKLQREAKLRRRLADREVHGAANALLSRAASQQRREEDDAAFVGRVVENLGVGEMFTGDIADVEAEEDEFEDADDGEGGDGDGLGGEGGGDGYDDGLLDSEEEATLDEEAKAALRAQRRDQKKDEEAIRARMPSMQRERSARALRESARRSSEDSLEGEGGDGDGDGDDGVADGDGAPQAVGPDGTPLTPSRWRPPPSRQTSLAIATAAAKNKELPSLPNEVPIGEDGHPVSAAAAAAGSGVGSVGRRSRRRKGKPAMPHLAVIPEMVPLFVEMVRPALRPARTASASTTRSLDDLYQRPGPLDTSAAGTRTHGLDGADLVASPVNHQGGPSQPPARSGWFW